MRSLFTDPQKKAALILGVLFSLALGVLLLYYAARPITDPDFWWHLKAGEVMVQQGGLLQSDPFTFHEYAKNTTREVIILKG